MIKRQQVLTIESGLHNLHKIEQFVEEISDFYNINNTYFGNILISLLEAVENAIIHGNKEDISKKVTVYFDATPNGLSFIVKDEGAGFDLASIPSPVESEEKEGEKIRKGIYLIRSLADEVHYKENGSVLEMQFYISSITYQLSMERNKALKSYFQMEEQKAKKMD